MRGSAGLWLLIAALLGAAGVGYFVFAGGGAAEYEDELDAGRAAADATEAGPMLAGRERDRLTAPDALVGEFKLSGVVKDAGGAPAADVRVTARRRGEEPADWGAWSGGRELRRAYEGIGGGADAGPVDAEAQSAADGTFTLTLERRGLYELRAEPAPPRTGTWVTASTRKDATATLELRVVDGSPLRGRVLDAEGRGVAVTLHASWHGQALGSWKSGPLASDAASGAFALAAVPEGEVSLEVVVAGRSRYTARTVKTPTSEEIVIRVDAEAPLLTGRVVTRAGQPIAGALVGATLQSALPLAASDGAQAVHVRYFAESGADGTFTVHGPLGGLLGTLEAVAPGFLYHVSSAPIAPWSGVQLATPAAGPIEIVLFQGGIVEGRTLEKGTQKPLAGVEVRTLPMALDARVGHGIQPVTTSDAQGRFRLEGVPLGRSSLSARHDTHYLASTGAQGAMPGQWISTPDGMHMVTPGGGGAPALTVFIETEGQRVTRDLELEQGLEIAGKVVGPDGQPAAGAAVMNANQQGEMMFYEGHMTQQRGTLATSDAEGRFTARGLAPSKSLVLVARKAGLIGVRSEPQTLAADAPPKEVVLRLEKGGSLAGQVLDDVGAPAGGVNVQAWPESGDGSWHQAQVLTKADGTFRVEGVGAGSWWVNAWSDDGRHASSRVTGLVAGEAREGVTLKLAKSVQLKGVLVDERGRPVASKMLTSQGTGGGMSQSYSGADGKFTFGGIQAGTQQIYAGDWGSSRLLLGSFEAPASDVRVVWKEPPFGVIEGTVLDAAGRPVPLCSVSIRAGPPAPAAPSGVPMPVGVPMPAGDWGGGQQAVNGWFRQRVGGEPPYQVRVSAPQDTEGRALNLLPTTVTVTDPAGGPLTIRLEPGLEIAGRVLDGSGRGVSDVPVLVGSLRTSTLPDGYFSVGGLTEGTHKVNVQPLPPLVRPPETSATTGTKDLVIRLVTGLPIAGTLRRADGRPVTQGWVNVSWPNSGGTAAGNSGGGVDAQGRFRLEGLPPDALVTVNANVHVQDGPAFAPRTLKDVRPGTENLEIVLGVGAVVSGSVTDAQGRPGKNGSVQLERLADDGKVTSTFQAQLKEDGTFEMGGLEPGPMQVRFVTYDGGAPSETLKIEAPASGVKLVLPERTPIRGRLIGTLGEIGRWQVWAWSVEEPARRVRANITGDGEFSLDGVSGKGPWMVAARAEGDDRYGLAGPLDGGAEGVRLELRTGRSIEGTVQSLSGTPIPTTGLRVMVTMPGFDTRVVTDAQGAFRVRGLPPGRYTLSARGVERAYGEQVKDVADGATGVRLTVK